MKSLQFDPLDGARGQAAFKKPINMDITEDGHKFVVDITRREVLEFGQLDEYLRTYGDASYKPTDVAVAPDRLYITDVDKHCVHVLSRETGKELSVIGREGASEGTFKYPTNIALDADGNLYVSDMFNTRVQKFSPDGEFVGLFGKHGDVWGTFSRPKGIDVDSSGRIYVVDAAFENVQVFDPDFHVLTALGEPGTTPGRLLLAADVWIEEQDIEWAKPLADPDFELQYVVAVTSQWGDNKVSVYGFGEWKGPALEAPAASDVVEDQSPSGIKVDDPTPEVAPEGTTGGDDEGVAPVDPELDDDELPEPPGDELEDSELPEVGDDPAMEGTAPADGAEGEADGTEGEAEAEKKEGSAEEGDEDDEELPAVPEDSDEGADGEEPAAPAEGEE